MQKTEQRAFAAVRPGKRGPHIFSNTIRFYARATREATGAYFVDGWPEATRRGWRIRPVVIRVEDENEGATTHD